MPKYVLTAVALILTVGLSGPATGIGPQMEPFRVAVPTPRAGPVAEPFGLALPALRIGPECEPHG